MNKIKKVLLFAMSFVMATGLFAGCMGLTGTNSSSESTVSESSSESPAQSSTQSSLESSTQSSTESSVESSVESSTESSVESSTESSVEAQKYNFTVVTDKWALDGATTTEVEAGATLVFPADPTAEGKTFAGWVDIEGNAVAEGATMPEEDFAIFASWTVNAYTLTIKEEGKEDVTLKFGVEAVPAEDPADEIIDITTLDYVLSTMYVGSEEIAYEFEGKPEEWALADTTITVVETIAKYELTIVTNKTAIGGTTKVEVEYGATLPLPTDAPTMNGKTFAGWEYSDGSAVEADATMPGKDITIYAVWDIVPYTLTITQDGKDDVTLTFGIEGVEATETTAAIIGIDELDSAIEALLPEATETEEFVFEGKPAEWTLEDTTISIVSQNRRYWLVIQDGNPTDPNAYNSEELVAWGSAIELPARENTESKTFIGWFYMDPETEEEAEAPETMPTCDLRVYAKWELVTKTLTINKADGSVQTYAIAVETKYDYFNPITGLDEIPFFLENIMTEPRSQFYTVSYEGIPETWELQDYTINEVEKSSLAYFDRLNKSWAEKTNVNNYWDGAENVVSVEHLADGVTKVGFDATLFTDEQVAAGNSAWGGWADDRQMWVTFAVPVNGVNLHKYTVTFEVKFENMKAGLNIFAMNNYVGNEDYDFVKGAEKGCSITNAEDLGDGWYRFTVQIPAGDVAGEAADYLLLSFDNTGEGVDKSQPSYAYVANINLLCNHEYFTACDTTCELCGEERYDASAHTNLTEEYISNGWGGHYQLCLDCGAEVNAEGCETRYVFNENGHYEVCDVCGYETDMYAHDFWSGYTDEGHYDEGCYCGYILSEIIPHETTVRYDESYHWEACDCWWESEYIPHSGQLEMTENGHKVLGCDGCEYEGSDEEVPHAYGEWTVSAENDRLSERECACGAKQVIKNRIDTPAYFFVGEEVPTLDLTDIFSEGLDPMTVRVVGATATYEDYTYDFFAYNFDLIVGDDGTITYEFDSEKAQAAPSFYGDKVIVITLELEDYTTIDIPVTVTAVTKVIKTVEELQELGVGGGIQASTDRDFGGRGNSFEAGHDVVGYYLLGNDLNATGYYFAAGYFGYQSYFKGTFDGNGHTISNVIVSEGGIFGGISGATIKNVNFTNVEYHGNGAPLPKSQTSNLSGEGYNNTTQYGQQMGLIAQFAASSTIENVNVQVSALKTTGNYGHMSGSIVYSTAGGGNKFSNIHIDATGLRFNNVLGRGVEDMVTFDDVTIKAAGYNVMGYADKDGTVALTEWPEGVTYEKVLAVTNWSDAILPLYEGDVTELGFEEGTVVYKHTAPAATADTIWSVMPKNSVKLTKDVDEDYASVQFVLGREFNTEVHSTYAFFSWMNVIPEGATEKVYAAGGWLKQDGTTVPSTEEKFNASENGFKFIVLDADGMEARSGFKANTVYTLRIYCDYLVELQLCVYAISGEPMDIYFANPSSGNGGEPKGPVVYDRYDETLAYYYGDVTDLGFAEGTPVYARVQDNRTAVWTTPNTGDLGKTMEQQCIKITKTAEEDYASIQFSLSRDLTGSNAFFAWCYPTTSGGDNCTTVTVSKNGTGSGGDITVKVFDLEGNEVTNIEAGKAYEMRFYSETNIRFQIGCMEANGEYITTYFANPSSGNDA